MAGLQNIAQHQMTRKEFIATLGFGIASLFGFSRILSIVLAHRQTPQAASIGYGANGYGGR